MKKFTLMFGLMAFLMLGLHVPAVQAQDEATDTTEVVEEVDTAAAATDTAEPMADEPAADETEEMASADAEKPKQSVRQVLLQKFLEGGAGFMSLVLIALIFGLAFCIERIISLGLIGTNTQKLLEKVEAKLKSGDVEGAKEVCKSNRSPIASIMFQGLERKDEGIDIVEKSVIAYGSVEMGRLERGLTWISLAIAIAPMLGFMGTVIGMIGAFDAIEAAGDISPTVVAGGIKVALLTTVFGLIVAVILQIFYNYIVSRIDSIVNDMEDASITFVDMLIRHNVVSKN